MPRDRLTTTSYALLGQLAMQPWSMYDLAAHMRRNVRFFHPRAESQIYQEAKRLAKLGLAQARKERTGKRGRTVYSLTDKGRLALTGWLARAPEGRPELDFEGLLRVFLAPFGTDGDLRAAIESARLTSDEIFATGTKMRDEYLAGKAPFQRYVVYRSFLHDFLLHFAAFLDDWAQRSVARLDRWPKQGKESRLAAALTVFRESPSHARKPRVPGGEST